MTDPTLFDTNDKKILDALTQEINSRINKLKRLVAINPEGDKADLYAAKAGELVRLLAFVQETEQLIKQTTEQI